MYTYQASPLGDGAVLLHLPAQSGLDFLRLVGRPTTNQQSGNHVLTILHPHASIQRLAWGKNNSHLVWIAGKGSTLTDGGAWVGEEPQGPAQP